MRLFTLASSGPCQANPSCTTLKESKRARLCCQSSARPYTHAGVNGFCRVSKLPLALCRIWVGGSPAKRAGGLWRKAGGTTTRPSCAPTRGCSAASRCTASRPGQRSSSTKWENLFFPPDPINRLRAIAFLLQEKLWTQMSSFCNVLQFSQGDIPACLSLWPWADKTNHRRPPQPLLCCLNGTHSEILTITRLQTSFLITITSITPIAKKAVSLKLVPRQGLRNQLSGQIYAEICCIARVHLDPNTLRVSQNEGWYRKCYYAVLLNGLSRLVRAGPL